MYDIDSPASYVVVAAAAVLAPILAEVVRRWRVPSVLFELLLGILIGPEVLGWAEETPFLAGLATLGLAFLMFLAGFELDFARVRGAPLRLATKSWLCSLALGLMVGFVLSTIDFAISDLLVGLALTTTALGTLLPMLSDRGILPTRFGAITLAAGAAGEFGPILAITLLLSTDGPAREIVLLSAFVVVAVATAAIAARPQPPRIIEFVQRHTRTSAQIPVRVAMLLLATMLLLAYELHLDTLLGAFTAGLVFRLALGRGETHAVETRLHATGYGFVIPVFFIVSGMNFDVDALVGSPSAMLRVPIFLALMLVVRGLPVLFFYRRELSRTARRALAVLQSTALPIIVVITEIGLRAHTMRPENATALVAAGMLSVLIFPLLGFTALARSEAEPSPQPSATGTSGADT